MLNARLEDVAGRALHSLDDPAWGCAGTLFGRSRKITGTTFGVLAGWCPRVAPAADGLAAMLPAGVATS
jgi:hypothetical protein